MAESLVAVEHLRGTAVEPDPFRGPDRVVDRSAGERMAEAHPPGVLVVPTRPQSRVGQVLESLLRGAGPVDLGEARRQVEGTSVPQDGARARQRWAASDRDARVLTTRAAYDDGAGSSASC